MILLKTTVLVVGMMSLESVNVSHTVVPSMAECRGYLAAEKKGVLERSPTVKFSTLKDRILYELTMFGNTANVSVECIEIKGEA
jgi:hypothetical protein